MQFPASRGIFDEVCCVSDVDNFNRVMAELIALDGSFFKESDNLWEGERISFKGSGLVDVESPAKHVALTHFLSRFPRNISKVVISELG